MHCSYVAVAVLGSDCSQDSAEVHLDALLYFLLFGLHHVGRTDPYRNSATAGLAAGNSVVQASGCQADEVKVWSPRLCPHSNNSCLLFSSFLRLQEPSGSGPEGLFSETRSRTCYHERATGRYPVVLFANE